ncbi:MAG: uracil phosphoribosyltransferase [Gemmatimonadota bacterium]|jgi:uracil phosphoribosyltransferase
MSDHANLTVLDHPLIQHKLSLLRDRSTPKKLFAELVDELAALMAYEATRNLELEEYELDTPMERTTGHRLRGKKLVIVPILRAGLGMVHGMVRLIPNARVGHVGLYRDEKTLRPVEYYFKMPPEVDRREFIVVDPMLATGGSASAAVTSLRERGAKDVRFMCIVAAPEGVTRMQAEHPDVPVYAAVLDRQLDENGYIRPGLGDAGDRLFGTR